VGQITIYLPDELEAAIKREARAAETSVSAYVARALTRKADPRRWPKSLLDVLDRGRGDLEVPDDPPPEDPDELP
jgi:predicted transcriptional regulator